MQKRCSECGKQFPIGQDWCNWCGSPPDKDADEADVTQFPSRQELKKEFGQTASDMTIFQALVKIFLFMFGLLLIAGGGVVSLCGVAVHDPIILLGLILLAAGMAAIGKALGHPKKDRGSGSEAEIPLSKDIES